MDWSKIGDGLAGLAPTLATMLGGPLAGAAVGQLESFLGLTPGSAASNPASLQTALMGMTADQAIQLRTLDNQMKQKLIDANIQLEDISARDRDSARVMQTQVKDPTVRILAFMIITSFIGVVVATLAGWSKADGVLAGTLIGYLSAKAEQVISYYFGSSSSSDRKTELLAQSSPTTASPPVS